MTVVVVVTLKRRRHSFFGSMEGSNEDAQEVCVITGM